VNGKFECSTKTLQYIRSVLSKVSIHVVRNYRNNARNSRPCQNCIDFLKYANVKNIYYSDDNGRMVKTAISKISNGVISKGQRATRCL
jgi:hypothetical protein